MADHSQEGSLDKTRRILRNITDGSVFQNVVLLLIILNAVILGAETISPIYEQHGAALEKLDGVLLVIFVLELVIRIFAHGRAFFRNGWNIFDFVIIAISVLAFSNLLAALRAFRVLRLLRVITVMPRMRVVVSALIDSIPGILSVGVVVLLIIYVFAVLASNLYGVTDPALFSDVFTSMYTLFQVMTLEGWHEIASDVADDHPNSWIFFVTFLLVATFTMLNLFVAIVVRVVEEDSEETEALVRTESDHLHEEIKLLRSDIANMQKLLVERTNEQKADNKD